MDLSIILPVYNVEPYLRECLDSIFGKKIGDFELIAVNDGSTDASLKILEEYNLKYSNMKLINQENKGLSVARNVGLGNARGQYIYFFDSDDILTEGIDLFNSIDKKENIDIITFDAEVFENQLANGIKNDNSYKEPRIDFKEPRIINDIRMVRYSGSEYLKIIQERNSYSPVVWRRIYKKSFLVENNLLFHPGLIPAEDDLHLFRSLFLNPNIIYCEKTVLLHRIRSTSIMSTLNMKRSHQSFSIILSELLSMKKLYNKSSFDKEVIDWIINVFVRRTHLQKPNLEEARRLVKLLKENGVRISVKTLTKLFLNVVGNRNFG
ncbi:hypothetical protein IIM_04103 [Bacillus cereus VD107]|nr:hypothetical protein IIM_04103 [Bacillus cereus VD107]